MSKEYVKLFGLISLTAWQYEILGCIPLYLLAMTGMLAYLNSPNIQGGIMILIPSTILLMIGILSPINVYYKEKNGFYDDPYYY